MPGVRHLGFIMTTLLGIGGSIIGGLIGRLFSKPGTRCHVSSSGIHPIDYRRDRFAFYLDKIGRRLTKATPSFAVAALRRDSRAKEVRPKPAE
jgi:hypothetical protein